MNTKRNASQHTFYRAIVLVLVIALIVVTSKQMRLVHQPSPGKTES